MGLFSIEIHHEDIESSRPTQKGRFFVFSSREKAKAFMTQAWPGVDPSYFENEGGGVLAIEDDEITSFILKEVEIDPQPWVNEEETS